MVFLYITVVLMLVSIALWAIMCCHYLLQRQRYLNVQWADVNALLEQRNSLLGEVQNLWVAPGLPAPSDTMQHLQDLLAQDTEMNWQDVKARAALRQRIESLGQQVLSASHQQPDIARNPALNQTEQMLRDNAMFLDKSIKNYNRSVQIYNEMLQQFPQDMLSRKMGLERAPSYRS